MTAAEPGPVSTNEQVIVAGHLTVDAKDRQVYLRSCEAVVRDARFADGCLDYAISADLIDPTRVNVYEHWRDAAALATFRQQGPDDDQMTALRAINVSEYQLG